ncbi:Major antigen [Orchesella cincta]|uniref:Major antigen n=1 Tax=Orchesella cincta TaxID=48709 RepID=A0A1D2MLY7_ORCCI|nr:Major antigen [Orchesella cincta]
MNEELKIINEENHIMRKEIEKMENKLNSLQASTQNLTEENTVLKREITGMIDRKDALTQSLERERVKSDIFEKENKTMKETVMTIDAQLKESSEQRTHWQERARCSESQVWELQLHLESREDSIKELTKECDALRDEKMQLIDLKSKLKSNLDKTAVTLKVLGEKNEELKETFEAVKAERDAKAETLHALEEILEKTKNEFTEVEKELLSFKLQNVRRRREWGNALYFIVSPMDAMKKRLTQ